MSQNCYVRLARLPNLTATIHQRVNTKRLAHSGLLKGLEDTGRRVNKWRLLQVTDYYELVVFCLSIHAVVGLHVVRLEDRVLRVEEVLLSKHLHQQQFILLSILQSHTTYMDIQAPLGTAKCKSDIVFFSAFSQLKRFSYVGIGAQIIKVAAFATLIPINLINYSVPYNNLIVACIVNLVASAIGLLYQLMLTVMVYSSVNAYINIADQSKHTVPNEPINDISSIERCVSATIFVAQNEIKVEDLNEEGRKLHFNVTKNTIVGIIKGRFPWSKTLESFYSILSLGSMIFSIYTLATVPMQTVNTVILSLYVAYVGLSQLQFLFFCLLIALSPLICIGLIFFCCCCGNRGSSNQFLDVHSIEATSKEIMNAGGDCSICYMSITLNQKIFVLPCSDKHVFHCECLRHWAKVKNTCPICRTEIPMTDVDRGSQIGGEPIG